MVIHSARFCRVLAAGLAMALASSAWSQPSAQDFPYQAQVKKLGSPLNGTADFRFRLWDAAAGGNQGGNGGMQPGQGQGQMQPGQGNGQWG